MTETNHEQIAQLAKTLPHYTKKQLEVVLHLAEENNTIPFIARYRKEKTGNLDEVQLKEILDTATYLTTLTKRKSDMITRLIELDKLTPELKQAIIQTSTLTALEELYQPYKQKRKTKAMIAKENGLAPLADWIYTYPQTGNLKTTATHYLNEQVPTIEEALAGAQSIIAESINESIQLKKWIKEYSEQTGRIATTQKKKSQDEAGRYEMYYDFSEKITTIVPHRILAINRGEKEGVLKVHVQVEEQKIMAYLQRNICPRPTIVADFLAQTTAYAYKKLLFPAIEREIRNQLTEKAETQAIHVFGENLRNLLLQSPLKNQTILGLDPAYRTGCKLAVIDPTGAVLEIAVIYPHKPASKVQQAESSQIFQRLLSEYPITMVAIGNGTASRESEVFVAQEVKKCARPVYFTIVSEAGASIYSASEVARKEFPELSVEKRSAISIARRLQDPLAELVKIDPQSVGVGQYQHDVSQSKLTHELDFIVETVVNQVGVDVNTASAELLVHVAGLNQTTAQNIVAYRFENGPFEERKQLKKVPRLGPKAFEQAVGFLRIFDGKEPLDQTAIHPESYALAEKLLEQLHLNKQTLGTVGSEDLPEERISYDLFTTKIKMTRVDFHDLYTQLCHPRLDIRDTMPKPILRQDILTIDDLTIGAALKGTIRNVVDFGAFVDIGLKQDGLVHVSKMSTRFVKQASALVAVGDIVNVWVDAIDSKRQRVSLTMIDPHIH